MIAAIYTMIGLACLLSFAFGYVMGQDSLAIPDDDEPYGDVVNLPVHSSVDRTDANRISSGFIR